MILPPTVHNLKANENTKEVREIEARITRERAEKRLQTLTKEVDWRVAKVYVALADEPGEAEEFDRKLKEGGVSGAQSNLEARAIGIYLDDDEWEERNRRRGIMRFPPVDNKTLGCEKDSGHRWWQWN